MKFFVPILLLLSVGVCAQTQTENYIKKTTFLKPIYSGVYSRTEILDMTHWPQGIFLLQVVADEHTMERKLVKDE